MVENMIIKLQCYECGEDVEIPFRPGIGLAEYAYCHRCKAGIEIHLNGEILTINRLSYEG